MHPVLVKVGWFSVYSFGFMLALSFLLGIYLSSYRGKRYGVDPQNILDLSVYVIIAGVIGSRLLYVAFHLDEYRSIVDVFALWQGGATLYGGLALAILAGYIFTRKRNLGFLLLGDVLAPAIALGIGLTRIGCFLSGCCYGKPTSHFWGVHFPPDSPAGAYAVGLASGHSGGPVALHPSQLYDSFFGLLTFVLLLVFEKRLRKQGSVFGLMLLCYGTFRFVIDFSRVYEQNMRVAGAFNLNQFVSAAMVAIGAYLILRKSEARRREPVAIKK